MGERRWRRRRERGGSPDRPGRRPERVVLLTGGGSVRQPRRTAERRRRRRRCHHREGRPRGIPRDAVVAEVALVLLRRRVACRLTTRLWSTAATTALSRASAHGCVGDASRMPPPRLLRRRRDPSRQQQRRGEGLPPLHRLRHSRHRPRRLLRLENGGRPSRRTGHRSLLRPSSKGSSNNNTSSSNRTEAYEAGVSRCTSTSATAASSTFPS